MGETLSKLFVDPTALPHDGFGMFQLVFLMAAYGYVLFNSSNMISDGSELLLLIPSLAGIVGSVVLPVLGAVPDGAIVLFSGLGPDAQGQLSVGVGALAGSTIMLLTIPWALSVFAGRVSLDSNGVASYKRPRGAPKDWNKLRPANAKGLTTTGVNVSPSIRTGAMIMMATTIPYFIIQGPAFSSGCGKKDLTGCHKSGEKYWALVGLIMSVLMFVGYLAYQVYTANNEVAQDKVDQVRKSAIENHLVSLSGAFGLDDGGDDEMTDSLLSGSASDRRLRHTLQPFFHKYDRDGNGVIDEHELRSLLSDLNEHLSPKEFKSLMKEMDTDDSGGIDFDEFVVAMGKLVKGLTQSPDTPRPLQEVAAGNSIQGEDASGLEAGDAGDDDESDEEEEEIPEEFEHLSPAQQKRAILMRSFRLMGVGTLLVLLFSDPMVGVLSEFGNRIDVPPFYVSFVLAPLASNASELLASYNYALKKTKKTITISLSALQGAACMNNTFCLGIFLALIFFKGLAWEFSAETISIVAIQLAMFFVGLKSKQTLMDAIIVIALYPLSIGMVILIELAGLN